MLLTIGTWLGLSPLAVSRAERLLLWLAALLR